MSTKPIVEKRNTSGISQREYSKKEKNMQNDTIQTTTPSTNWYNAMSLAQRIGMVHRMKVVSPQLLLTLNSKEIQLPKTMREYYINMLTRVINDEQDAAYLESIDDAKLKKTAKFILKDGSFVGSPMQMVKLISLFYKRRKPASTKLQNIVQRWS